MKLTRRQVAGYLADGLQNSQSGRVRQAAAWLIANRRDNELPHIIHDVESIMAARGHVAAKVTTAHSLSPVLRSRIESLIKQQTKAQTVELATKVDAEVIGGLQIELPDASLDTTVRTKLTKLVAKVSR